MGDGRAEVLHVITGHVVGVGAQRRQGLAVFHRRISKRIHLDIVEVIFAAEHGRKVVVNPGLNEIDAELPAHPAGVVAHGIGDVSLCSWVSRGSMLERPKPAIRS